MKRVVIAFVTSIFLAFGVQAATITSGAAGAFNASGTWIGGVVPTSADDVVVLHDVTSSANQTVRSLTILAGGKCTVNGGSFNVAQTLDIQSGGEMSNSNNVVVLGNYILNGVHSGTGYIYLYGQEISGTGLMTNNKELQLRSENKTVLAGSDLDFNSLRVSFKNSVELTNYGTLAFRLMSGTGLNKFINESGANLVFARLYPGFPLDASADNNTVTYSAPTSFSQFVYPSTNGYYNLVVDGVGAPGTKRLVGDVEVINELRIKNANLDCHYAGNHSDITLHGDWINQSGTFLARKATVHLVGDGDVSHHAGLETFNNLDLAGNTTLSTEITVNGFLEQNGNFDMQGQTVNCVGDWTRNSGLFTSNMGLVNFTGAKSSTMTGVVNFDNVTIDKDASFDVTISPGSRMNIFETLLLTEGVLHSNDGLVIRSTSTKTGRIGVVQNGSVNGHAHIERYLNAAANGWHLIAAPIHSMTLNEWKYDFITTGFTGSNYPSYPFVNITRYDETLAGHKDLGVLDVTDINETVADGEGRRAYIAGGYNLLKVKGDIITGDLDYNINFTPTAGGAAYDGWNLVANPYASTIDWNEASGWDKSNINDAIYVWDPAIEQYMSYIGGIGTNGGSQYIPSSQAFWVQANAAAPALRIKESAKTATAVTFKSNEDSREHFFLTMTTGNGRVDEAAVALREDATFEFDAHTDAYEFVSSNEEVPSIAFISEDDVDCSIYSVPGFDGAFEIPLSIHVGVTGEVRFTARRMKSFPGGYTFGVYDLETDETQPIADDISVTYQLDEGDYRDRFYLVVMSQNYARAAGNEWEENDLVIKFQAPNRREDIVVSRYDELATVDFDESIDLLKGEVEEGAPSVALVSNDGLPLELYGLGKLESILEIPMSIKVPESGVCRITVENRKEFPLFVDLSIYDMETHEEYPLARNQGVELDLMEGEYYDRFYLIMSLVARAADDDVSEADIQMVIKGENGRTDRVVLRHNVDATWDFDEFIEAMLDEPESEASPSLGLTSNDGIHLSDMSIPAVREIMEIPIVVRATETGNFRFSLENRKQFPFPVGLSIYDMESHTYHPFDMETTVDVELDEGEHFERFYLVLKPLMKDSDLEDMMTITLSNDQLVIINGGTEGKTIDFSVYNGLGQLLDMSMNQYIEREIRTDLPAVQGVILVELIEKNTGKKTIKKLLK